jgi:hypothetical protein
MIIIGIAVTIIITTTTTTISTSLVVDAAGPTYTTSNQQHQQQTPKHQQKQQQKHPWMIRSGVSQPTSRSYLDQCVSLLETIEQLRGGSSSSNSNDRDYYNNNHDDWTNVNYNEHNDDDDDNNEKYSKQQSNTSPQRSRTPTNRNSSNNSIGGLKSLLPNLLYKPDRKTGLMLLITGFSVTFLGITLFFNKTILRLGNLLCIIGVLFTIGPTQTIQYFIQPEKMRATICLLLGIFLVFIGSPLFGIILEVFGILNLFGNMFPILMIMMKQMPIIGTMLQSNETKNRNRNNNNRNSRRRDDDNNNYYDDSYYSTSSSSSSTGRAPSNQYDYDHRDDYREQQDDDEGLGRRY